MLYLRQKCHPIYLGFFPLFTDLNEHSKKRECHHAQACVVTIEANMVDLWCVWTLEEDLCLRWSPLLDTCMAPIIEDCVYTLQSVLHSMWYWTHSFTLVIIIQNLKQGN